MTRIYRPDSYSLADLYPDSNHVHLIGLGTSNDHIIWKYARDHEFVIVTRDADFSDLSVLLGFPPKVIWLRRGNCTTTEIELILRSNYDAVEGLTEESGVGILTLF